MRYSFLIPACLLLLTPAVLSAQDVDQALASTVQISGTRQGTPVRGSGFVVALNRGVATVMTASHVIEGATFEVTFAASGNQRFEVPHGDLLEMESGNPNGLAIFQVRGETPSGVVALDFDTSSPPRVGESLRLIGFPQRSRTPLTKSRAFSGRSGNLLLLDLPVGEGFSGGPVLRDGRVVGVVTGEDLLVTYAVSSIVAKGFLAGSKGLPGTVPGEPDDGDPAPLPGTQNDCRPGEEQTFQDIEFVRVCAGTFTMGSADHDERADSDEMPAHEVTLGEFWITRTEINNAQYRFFEAMRLDKGGVFLLRAGRWIGSAIQKPDDLPAASVSWDDAKAFCEHHGFRLPTEAEWEYAARAGSRTAWSMGDRKSDLDSYAWHVGNSERSAHPVGTLQPNPWGLHDMHGNVAEWVADWYGPYSSAPAKNPPGPTRGSSRVVRGGAFMTSPESQRSADRDKLEPETRFLGIGFRCAHNPPPQP